jgi:molybdopterin-guanine dinucleotide biosynthesis protein A
VSGALLVGGVSQRMGRDKAHVALAGEAIATRLARRLDTLCEELLLVGGDPPATAPGRRVPDLEGTRCALRGLASALDAARAERVLVLATDLPFVSEALLLALVAWPEADVVLPQDPGGPQPLCAVYRREPVLRAAARRLAAREGLALHALLAEVEVRVLPQDVLAALDPTGTALINVNTPADLARAQALVERGPR